MDNDKICSRSNAVDAATMDVTSRGPASADYLAALALRGTARLLVLSDSHGRLDFMRRCMEAHDDVDLVIHLGDHGENPDELSDTFTRPYVAVAGNNDSRYRSRLPDQLTLRIAGQYLFLAHGHRHGVKQQLRVLAEAAIGQPEAVSVVLFGHTHQKLERTIDRHGRRLSLFNPGSARGSAQAAASALLLEIDPACLRHQWLD